MINRLDNARPFLVYAVDAPTYPNFYGMYNGKHSLTPIEGSLIVISGGRMDVNSDSGGEEVFMEGCLALEQNIGSHFAERVITELVQAEERVVILCPVLQEVDLTEVEVLRQGGFQITLAIDTVPGYSSTFVVGVGNGAMLHNLAWLMDGWGYDNFCLLASRRPSYFEEQIVRSAQVGLNPAEVCVEIFEEVHKHPGKMLEMFDDFNLIISFIDNQFTSVQVNRRSTDISGIGELFRTTAADLGIPLYDAGRLSELKERGHFFTEFEMFNEWQPLSQHWTRVA